MFLKKLHLNHLSIRVKLTLPYVLLSLLVGLGGGVIVTRLMLESVDKRFERQLTETRILASELMVQEEDRLLETLRLISFTEGVPAAIVQRNPDEIKHLVYPVTFNAGEDVVLVLDKQGAVLAAMLRKKDSNEYEFPEISEKLDTLPFVARLIRQEVDKAGDKYSGLSDKWGTCFFVSGPVKDEKGDVVGFVLVGESLKGIIDRITEETLGKTTLYDPGFNPIISGLPKLPSVPKDITAEAVLNSKDKGSFFRDMEIDHVPYTEALGVWEMRNHENIGILGTALSKDFVVESNKITRWNVTLEILLAITAAILLGVSLASAITRPILKLKNAASEISRGNLEISVDLDGNDEVAVLAKSFNEMARNLRRSEKSLIQAYDKTIEGWVKALELRDRETLGHTLRAANMTMELARLMGVDEKDLQNIWRGVLLHDIGKMGIPDSILLKEGPLDYWERKIMERHPALAREMLNQIEFLRPCMDIPTYHHEKWDGSGYPDGLVGEEIPITARLFMIVDVWDALTSHRPYRQAWSEQETLQYIKEQSGKHFDPKVVKAFVELIETGFFHKNDQKTIPSPQLTG
ncbi:MAG TPA: HD domain-containing phosphohydrolase [Anaerolineales bacterium]|nr:HD domain-containing phosphohydrolase [Anaerolineales bacterium]